jgi:hypothetical protein
VNLSLFTCHIRIHFGSVSILAQALTRQFCVACIPFGS